MRITVAHTKTKREIKDVIDRSFEDFFQGLGSMPFSILEERRQWNGDTLTFSFDAKMSLFKTPIRGTIVVTDKDVTIDADLGLLDRLLSKGQAKTLFETRVRGLLA